MDITDAKKAVQDYTYLKLIMPGLEPKLLKSKVIIIERHILLGPLSMIHT